jgi:hypothetical protein
MWRNNIRPGDIVMFNLPENNSTLFGKLVLRFQQVVKINNRKTHVAMVVDAGDSQPKTGEMALKVVDIEFGRKGSTYFIPRQYGDIDIYRPFTRELSCSFPDGTAKTASSEMIARRAAEIALSYQGASYSVHECFAALEVHHKSAEHLITDDYLIWVKGRTKDSPFMCVSFVLTCFQQACLELLGGLPPAFRINAHSTPRYFANHIETSGHFTKLPESLIREIRDSGAPVYRSTHTKSRFSWFRRHDGRGAYEPLIAGPSSDDFSDQASDTDKDNEVTDNGAGIGLL